MRWQASRLRFGLWLLKRRTGLTDPGGGAHRLLGLTLRPAGEPPGCCAGDTGGGIETRGAELAADAALCSA